MRCAILAGSMLLGAGTPASTAVEIPGAVDSIPAPDGSGARIFYRPHMASDGSQESAVFYDDGHGRLQRIATLTRSMEIGWSADGRRAFVQDNWGSNIADCIVLSRKTNGITGLRLLRLIQRIPNHPSGDETPYRSHYYVHCDRWRSPNEIEGGVSGHTDDNPSRDFSHPFIYDARTHKLTWQR
jgi:hypothetical protein